MPDAKAPAAPARPVGRPVNDAPARAPIDKVKAGVAGGLSIAAIAAALAAAGLMPDEGRPLVDYLDLAKVPTACFGHTGPDVQVGRRRTPAECQALLDKDVAAKQAGVAACVPALRARPYQWAASTRMAYNTGVPAFCGSSTARAFRAGQWSAGCDAMLLWNKARVNGSLAVIPGLTARRQRERAQCLTGVAA